MKITNSERTIVAAIRAGAGELGLDFKAYSQGWIIKLSRQGSTRYVFGYNFDLNASGSQLIANDKCATADLLREGGIPAVPHSLFLKPALSDYVAANGNWSAITNCFEEFDANVVCKSNTGTGGNSVFRARSQVELERAVHKLFQANRAIAISPFFEIEAEYRLIMLDGSCELAYEKIRPEVTGDGQSSLLNLIQAKYEERGEMDGILAGLPETGSGLSGIPGNGERIALQWKHNLGQGAQALGITDKNILEPLNKIALDAMTVLNLRFASVDIIKANSSYAVLEVNSGVMMEWYAKQGEKENSKSFEIYKKALIKMFE